MGDGGTSRGRALHRSDVVTSRERPSGSWGKPPVAELAETGRRERQTEERDRRQAGRQLQDGGGSPETERFTSSDRLLRYETSL